MPPLPLAPELMARWGIAYDANGCVLRLAPRVVAGESRTECPAFRAGRSVIELVLRQRPSGVVLRVAVRFGPPLRVEAALSGGGFAAQAFVDGVPVVGPTVAFEARGDHEVSWLG